MMSGRSGLFDQFRRSRGHSRATAVNASESRAPIAKQRRQAVDQHVAGMLMEKVERIADCAGSGCKARQSGVKLSHGCIASATSSMPMAIRQNSTVRSGATP